MDNEGAVVVHQPQQFGLIVARDPNTVLAEAHNAAKALKQVISAKKNKVMMNGEQYLEFEDWQTCGKFYGVVAKVVNTEYIELGGVRGFNSRAVVFDTATGQEISAAEAMCLNDEDKWSTRSKYEYVDGVKKKVGDVPVPLFQLKSMAQTRACSKALRNVLAWVVVLAGYQPTPAEDMTGDEAPSDRREPITEPKEKPSIPSELISDAQARRLYAIWKGAGRSDAEVQAHIKEKYGVSSTKQVKKADYEALCLWAASKTLDAQAGDAQE